MKLEITVRSSDPEVINEIARGKIAEGITIRRSLTIREILNPPIDFVIYVGEHIALPIAASLIARYLYDKLKDRKDNELVVESNPVEVNVEKIELTIINIEKEEKD